MAANTPGAEIPKVPAPPAFGTDSNVWCNDNSLEEANSTFIGGRDDAKERLTNVLSEATDPVYAAPPADDAALSRYD